MDTKPNFKFYRKGDDILKLFRVCFFLFLTKNKLFLELFFIEILGQAL